MRQGTIISETTTVTGNISVNIQFPATIETAQIATGLVKIGEVRPMANIGNAADSLVDTLDDFSTSVQNSLHRHLVYRF